MISKGFWVRSVFILLLSVGRHADGQTDSAQKARQLLRIEQELMDALPGDSSLWSRYLDDRWYIITEDGSGYHKQDFLKSFAPFSKGFSGHINVARPVVTFFDKMAIVHFVADEYEIVWGQQLHTSYAVADTFYPTDSSWKMIGSQIFEIPQLPPAIKISASTLKRYTGNYELTAGKIAHVSLKNDSLFIQKNAGKTESLFAETNAVFFLKSDSRGRKIFTLNEKGEPVMLERRNGNDLVWKRKP